MAQEFFARVHRAYSPPHIPKFLLWCLARTDLLLTPCPMKILLPLDKHHGGGGGGRNKCFAPVTCWQWGRGQNSPTRALLFPSFSVGRLGFRSYYILKWALQQKTRVFLQVHRRNTYYYTHSEFIPIKALDLWYSTTYQRQFSFQLIQQPQHNSGAKEPWVIQVLVCLFLYKI